MIKKFRTEEEMQEYFCNKLKQLGWVVKDDRYDIENWSVDGSARIDVLAYHPSFATWLGFELKNFSNTFGDLTRALRQMYDKYKKQSWNKIGNVKLLSLILPSPLREKRYGFDIEHGCGFNVSFAVERFFWRFGFGIGDCSTMKVAFNQTQKYTLDLLNPKKSSLSTPWKYLPKQKILEIQRITH